ncbi:MAG: class E sortase [Ilumatobacteraceae bacterium]|nr:class E sortase [Ilumatobacteraceae bacterium]
MSEKPPASHEKLSHWDRPKPPHDWRWVVGGVGRVLITLGLLMFAFVAYQLWGTGIQTAQAQRTLSREFDEAIGTTLPTTTTLAPSTTDTPTTDATLPIDPATPTTTTAAVVAPAKPIPPEEKGVARLEIPRMGLNRIVVEGATADALTKGPGHFPETPLPGQLGNAAIAGHRTTHLHPFFDIDKLQPGDQIFITTFNGRYVYQVTGTEVVDPNAYADVIPTTDVTKATLTLVSCTPRYSATNRIVVRADLVPELSDALTEAAPVIPFLDPANSGATLPDEGSVTVVDTVAPTATTASAITAPGNTAPADTTPVGVIPVDTTPGDTVPAQSSRPSTATTDAFVDGWFSDTSAIAPSILWGLALAAVAAGIYLLSRTVRRYWVGVLAGFVPFLVVLYFFYENINRLLPPNL